MTDREKENLLHKIVASSAFVFALCILPVAQYLLGGTGALSEKGTVAGVSTDQSITEQSVAVPSPSAAPLSCVDQQKKDLADLDSWMAGKKAAITREYDNAVKPYRDAIPSLQGTPSQISANVTILNQKIADAYAPYDKRLSAAESAVASQKAAIESRSCLSE